jgi:hypothetical protein
MLINTQKTFPFHSLNICLGIVALITFGCSQHQKESSLLGTSIGQIIPKNSSEIASSPFGIQAGTLEDSLVAKAAKIGVKWTRLGASWPSIEKEKGVYSWEETDQAYSTALKNGITPFITIGDGNKLYSKLSGYDDPALAEIYGLSPEPPIKDPVAMDAFLKFVKETVERYKGQIKYWEVWNEPNHRNYWGSDPNGKEYGKLLLETAKLIKQIDPDCKVIGGAMAGIDPKFTDDFLSTGSDKYIDIISYHNYGAVPEERVYLAIELWDVMNKYKPSLELWQGECGYPSHSSTRDFRGRAPWGLNIQAKWLLRQSFIDTYFCKATMSNYFKLAHTSGKGDKPKRSNLRPIDQIFGYPERGGSRVKTKGVNEKCLLTNPELKEKPAFFAYQNLCAIWQARYKPHVINYKVDVLDQGIFYGIGEEDDAFPSIPLVASFSDDSGNNLVAWWLPWNAQEYLPKLATIKIRLEGIQFKDPVMLDLLEGKVYEVNDFINENGNCTFNNLALADYPLLIVERKSINIK